jgi:hypothetical protein
MAELLNRDSAEVLSEDDDVGRLANFQAALEAFLKGRKGAVDGVHADRCGQVDALVGATDIPGHRPTRQRLLDAKQRGIVRHRGIGAASNRNPVGDETFERGYMG